MRPPPCSSQRACRLAAAHRPPCWATGEGAGEHVAAAEEARRLAWDAQLCPPLPEQVQQRCGGTAAALAPRAPTCAPRCLPPHGHPPAGIWALHRRTCSGECCGGRSEDASVAAAGLAMEGGGSCCANCLTVPSPVSGSVLRHPHTRRHLHCAAHSQVLSMGHADRAVPAVPAGRAGTGAGGGAAPGGRRPRRHRRTHTRELFRLTALL